MNKQWRFYVVAVVIQHVYSPGNKILSVYSYLKVIFIETTITFLRENFK